MTAYSHTDRQSRLQAVIALSQQMIDIADQGDWQQFAELEKKTPHRYAGLLRPAGGG